MLGIAAYGAYLPLYRLDKKTMGGRGEKAVCSFDEDSVTMAVEAARDCLKATAKDSVQALLYATTTSKYQEHLEAATIAMASDLPLNIYTAQFGNSLRAGTSALKSAFDMVKSGSVQNCLVCASDCRLAPPGSLLEQNLGDGAVALLVSDQEGALSIEASEHIYNEIYDVWRNHQQEYVRSWENRFVLDEGYFPAMEKAIKGLMNKGNYSPADFSKLVLYSPDARRSVRLAKGLGFDAQSQLQDPLINEVGDTGAASALMILAAALEEAKPGDRILLASYGNGADAFCLQVHEEIDKMRSSRKGLGLKGHLQSKQVISDYMKYLRWKEILPAESIPGPHAAYSAVAAKRENESIMRLHGTKCRACGYVQYPPQRVCTNCRTKDQMDSFSFQDQRGKVFTYNLDYITPRAERPVVTTEVDFEAGGRIQCYMTEADPDKLTVDLPVEMAFRRNTLWQEIPLREGIYTYFWESKPVRG